MKPEFPIAPLPAQQPEEEEEEEDPVDHSFDVSPRVCGAVNDQSLALGPDYQAS